VTRSENPRPVKFPFAIGPYGSTTLAYDKYRMSAPVCRVMMPSGLEAWLVTRYADVCTVFRDPRFSRQEAVRVGAAQIKGSGFELNPDLIQNTDGKRHSRLRAAFSSYYSIEHSLHWAAIIEREAHEVLDSLSADCFFDVRSDFFEPVARRSAERLFGFRAGKRTGIMKASFDKKAMFDLQDHVSSILQSGGNALGSSYLQGVAATSRDGLLSQSELLANLAFFISLTFEAVAAPFLGGIFAMLRDLGQWQMCLKDRRLLPNAVNEMLRCYPNGDGQFLRIAMDKAELSNVTIRRGDAVLAPAPAANVDPTVFSDPRRFDVRRSNCKKHIAFGIGPHYCLGSFLVKVWMQTALLALLDRFPSLRLAIVPAAITYRQIPLINMMERLPVRC
jgi:cytochrome P450